MAQSLSPMWRLLRECSIRRSTLHFWTVLSVWTVSFCILLHVNTLCRLMQWKISSIDWLRFETHLPFPVVFQNRSLPSWQIFMLWSINKRISQDTRIIYVYRTIWVSNNYLKVNNAEALLWKLLNCFDVDWCWFGKEDLKLRQSNLYCISIHSKFSS